MKARQSSQSDRSLMASAKIAKELAGTRGYVQTEFSPVLEQHLTTVLLADTHPTDDVHYLFSPYNASPDTCWTHLAAG